jgi:hypothetical protein
LALAAVLALFGISALALGAWTFFRREPPRRSKRATAPRSRVRSVPSSKVRAALDHEQEVAIEARLRDIDAERQRARLPQARTAIERALEDLEEMGPPARALRIRAMRYKGEIVRDQIRSSGVPALGLSEILEWKRNTERQLFVLDALFAHIRRHGTPDDLACFCATFSEAYRGAGELAHGALVASKRVRSPSVRTKLENLATEYGGSAARLAAQGKAVLPQVASCPERLNEAEKNAAQLQSAVRGSN